ncbi:TetR family transcriptional regulator [Mycobacterium antarcticum]|uniref:TetR/AcrR family transcriptional regulator n=1 Tax=unclassified Mycolicibacterium TaxID=2636767 RepID=UPI0023A421A7|nr:MULTISPECIES: TetR/AcrR family transcriptional regulator [unclassified Mycolicibacterium]BDX34328.1 TetR family transcriptional regulator [Mycolicibacterium sp. TUM20985]GLP77537.1 TetR family transcriptional regulator [Mycolicibacterium sp. TUM20983]
MVENQPADGRERNKRATRQALRTATLELALERGIDAVTIDEIARRAGVSTRTFFNYFDTKEDAALLELFLVSDEELEGFAVATGSDVWAELTEIFTTDVRHAEQLDAANLLRYLQLHARHPELGAHQMGRFAMFLDRLNDAITKRLGNRSRLRAEVMAGSCITAVRVGLDQWHARNGKSSAATYVAAAFGEFDGAFGDR